MCDSIKKLYISLKYNNDHVFCFEFIFSNIYDKIIIVAVHHFILTDQRIASDQIIGFIKNIFSIDFLFWNFIIACSQRLNPISDTHLHHLEIAASNQPATYDEDNPQETHITTYSLSFLMILRISSYPFIHESSALI